MMRDKLTAIIACYKDEKAIPIMAERLQKVFEGLGVDWEAIFVNDGSPDQSLMVLEKLASSNSHIKVISHSRNFGSQNAFTSGMRRASGDACILLDGDLQDPPELIPEFYQKWKEGFQVVYGVRVKREMPFWQEFFYRLFYRLFKKLSYIEIPIDAGDFSLMDRKVIEALKHLPERDRFIRGLRAWVGFRQTGVPYHRPERMFGRSTNNWWSNWRWAKKGIFSFSFLPLEVISLMAFFTSGITAVAIFIQLIGRILNPNIPWGISTVIILVLFLGSVQLLSLAFIAEYIGKIFDEVKGRPIQIVDKEIGFEEIS